MSFTHYDLGGLPKGKVVEVILQGNTANVYLMDNENFAKYKRGMQFIALGGLMTFSPIRLQTIENGIWHVVIDLPQGKGQVKTAYQLSTKQPNISTKPLMFKPSTTILNALQAKRAAMSPSAATPSAAGAANADGKVICAHCRALTIRGKFCAECGTPMSIICPACSKPLTATCKFCPECGHKML